MAEKRKHSEGFDLMLNYLNDQLTDQQRYLFERELERDSFLGEAFEGLSQLTASEIEKDIRAIDVIGGKKRKTKRFLLPLSFAAGFLVLVISLFWFIRTGFHSEKQVAVIQKEKEVFPHGTTDYTLNEFLFDTVQGKSILLAETDLALPGEQDAKTVLPSNQSEIDKKKIAAGRLKGQGQKESTLESMKMIRAEGVELVLQQHDGANTQREEPGKGSEDSALTGLHSANIDPDSTEAKMNLPIQPPVRRPGVNAQPKPLGGTTLYREYLDKNTYYPSAAEPVKRDFVRLRFKVTELGEPYGFEIIRSPGESFSAEAIRVISEGPRWSPGVTDGIPVVKEVDYRITFKPK